MRTTLLTFAVLSLLGNVASASILNGDFENPVIASPWVSIGPGGLPDWTVTGNVDIVSTIGGSNWAKNNNQAIDLAGTPGPGSISQTFAVTAGQIYTLTFWASFNGSASPAALELIIDGVSEFITPSNFGEWTEYTRYFVGEDDGDATLTFATSLATNHGPLIDTVGVVALTDPAPVPEPASMAVWALGSIACAVVGYRRRKQVA